MRVVYHVESARIGIRLALLQMQGRLPPEDVVSRVLAHPPVDTELVPVEVSLDMLTHQARDKQQTLREYAFKAMEVLMVKHADGMEITDQQLERIAAKAWTMARCMMVEDTTAKQLNSLSSGST